ncbi:MAG: flagellar motor switch protein FliN [Parvularculaceae bacterium]|nr:flagellar motor switch protein FliN [Parvularculaceae bacterium]
MSALEKPKDILRPLADEDDGARRRPALESVYEIPVRLTAVLGKTRLSIAELMKLDAGSIIELDRRVGEAIDLYVNDRLIARGELVMVDGALGVTMTEVVKESEV